MKIFFRLMLAALAVFIAATGYALGVGGDAAKLLPISISLLAVFISVISAFRSELLPLELVLTGDLILSRAKTGGVDVSMNLGLLNKGYGEDIVEWVGLRVMRADGTEWNKRSVAELYLEKLTEGIEVKKGVRQYMIHGTNMKLFSAFPVIAKSAISRALFFLRMEDLSLGKHTFVVSLKLASAATPQEFLTHNVIVDQATVDSLSRPGTMVPIFFGEPSEYKE